MIYDSFKASCGAGAAWDELEVRWKGRLHPPFSDEAMMNMAPTLTIASTKQVGWRRRRWRR